MRKIGRILHYTKYKLFVVEASEALSLNNVVYDNRKKKIGIVVDVIGPINKPYLVLKPLVDKPEKYVGKEVYVFIRRRR